ncbi:MAG: hypothetical protein IPL61_28315 [Myxococcales bacterium]|nr:hypothetical protein [Myxococcales bacterium]
MTIDTAAALAGVRACPTLADAIVVGLRLAPPWSVVDVVVQDEFTHDVVFASDGDGDGGPALVLDCT